MNTQRPEHAQSVQAAKQEGRHTETREAKNRLIDDAIASSLPKWNLVPGQQFLKRSNTSV